MKKDPEWIKGTNLTFIKNRNCSLCGKDFNITKPYQLLCSEKCEREDEARKQEMNDKLYWTECRECGERVRKAHESGGRHLCMICKKKHQASYKRAEKPPKKSKKRPVSYEEMIRRMEWKRVWDDQGWDHYLSGKKYDKI